MFDSIGLATKRLRLLSLPPNDKIRNHLVAIQYIDTLPKTRIRVSHLATVGDQRILANSRLRTCCGIP